MGLCLLETIQFVILFWKRWLHMLVVLKRRAKRNTQGLNRVISLWVFCSSSAASFPLVTDLLNLEGAITANYNILFVMLITIMGNIISHSCWWANTGTQGKKSAVFWVSLSANPHLNVPGYCSEIGTSETSPGEKADYVRFMNHEVAFFSAERHLKSYVHYSLHFLPLFLFSC